MRKKGPRGVIELIDCWISPSNEDDVTFTVQVVSGETYKFRGECDEQRQTGKVSLWFVFISAIDAKERQRWIDKLRACSGTNAADLVSPAVYDILSFS